MKPRIIFINLEEINFLVRTFSAIIHKRYVKTYKHQFVLRYLQNNGYEILNLSKKESTIPFLKYIINTKLFKQLKMNYVTKHNSLKHIPVITNISEIKKNDIVCAYLVYDDQLELLKEMKCYKLLFGNHFISINEKLNLKDYGVNSFVNEIDLSHNDFVKENLGLNDIDSIILPYVYGSRFIVKTPFDDRLDKAMAIGTASDVKIAPNQYKVYKKYYNTTLVQPMRFEIYNHAQDLKDCIDSYISHICENNGKQSNYTKFDMVETFNKYKIAICPEELVGMPGIGFVESMASGCAYIGLDHEMYKCLGLIPQKHYITYNGTLDDLISKVNEYRNKPKELKQIAECGTTYVRTHFNERKIAENFEKQLIASYKKYSDLL